MRTVKLALVKTTQSRTLAIPCQMRAQPLRSAGFVIAAFFSQQVTYFASQRILTKRAASRHAEALEFSDSDDKKLNPDRPRFVGPHNSGWRHAPYLPAGPGQRNICINAQPVHLKAILKHTIKCLTRDCAFKHGYIPVERQTACLVRILDLSAEKMNRPYYTERVQKDPQLQRVICDLVGPPLPCIQMLTQAIAKRTRFTLPDKCQAGRGKSRDLGVRPFRQEA